MVTSAWGMPCVGLQNCATYGSDLVQVRYDAELAALRSGVERVVVELVVGPKSSAATRKAILPHMDDLAAFLGRRSAEPSEDLCFPFT